ncbi:MAG TPA: hypothetical protein ENN66_07960 [Proteobacteria bacterium]|nr:hypothetical protein [Pseudomonadota bacterium]
MATNLFSNAVSTVKDQFGNLRQRSLGEIFSGEVYRDFIAAHRRNDLRAHKVCMSCERCFSPAP